jgi:hypothetical protein
MTTVDDELEVVADAAWTPRAGDTRLGIRDIAEAYLRRHDLFGETAMLLDDWATRSGVVDILSIDGASVWHQLSIGEWTWLMDRIVWLAVVDRLVAETRPAALSCSTDLDVALVDAARLIAGRDGLGLQLDTTAAASPAASAGRVATRAPLATVALGPWQRWRRRFWPGPRDRWRRRQMRRRMHDLIGLAPPVVALREHERQQVREREGTRMVNPYLDPVIDRLRQRGVPVVTVELRADVRSDRWWERIRGDRWSLPAETLRSFDTPEQRDHGARAAKVAEAAIRAASTPLDVFGVDLGPALTDLVAFQAGGGWFGERVRWMARIRRLFADMRPAVLVLADEYHRRDWLAAARAEGVASVAVQHGLIWARHPGYWHSSRPEALVLPDRTHVFGRWEYGQLVEGSIYRPEEVVASGSPRLDLRERRTPESRSRIRATLGVAPGRRLLLVSGTWGPLPRRFHIPVVLARLFDRPIPGVHVVVKLHPGEPDEGPYRATIEGVATAGGFDPPPVSLVRDIDLYELLDASDAHLGLYSTVVTEAVVTGTPNLLAAFLATSDLLGYVEAGVARPVHDGADLIAALDDAEQGIDEAARARFVDDHFEPGPASERIAADILVRLGRA